VASHSSDVVVIGGGPGGYATALYAAAAGLSVILIERDKVGGTCLHRGCIPAKEFLETAHVYRTIQHAGDFGFSTGPTISDFSVSQSRKNDVVNTMHTGLLGLLKNRTITVLEGTGRLEADLTVSVVDGADAGSTVTAGHTVLATGSVPRTIPGFEVDGSLVVTSDEFLATVQGGRHWWRSNWL
jgi:dihydrolipoamide dehydrogenase